MLRHINKLVRPAAGQRGFAKNQVVGGTYFHQVDVENVQLDLGTKEQPIHANEVGLSKAILQMKLARS
jgi:hypothetical protein